MPPELFGARDLAVRLDMKYSDILTWTCKGTIPAIKAGKQYVYNFASVVEAILKQNRSVNAGCEATGAVASIPEKKGPPERRNSGGPDVRPQPVTRLGGGDARHLSGGTVLVEATR